jgi:diguanylate cyclase (GGDEF)-like protein
MRRVLLLLSSLALVLALGGVAAWTQVKAASEVENVHGGDRNELQTTLSGLTGQYTKFTFLAAVTAADQTPWSLRPGDPADVAALGRLTRTSPLTAYGASLVSLTGAPLSSFSTDAPLPPPTDPGYRPLLAALLAQHPGLSAVMDSGRHHVVAFAVPVTRGGRPVALLLSYADTAVWPLQGYDEQLHVGVTAVPYVLDANGIVAASGKASALGKVLPGLPWRALAGGSGTMHVAVLGKPSILSYAPAGNGWTALTVQDETAFSGSLQAGHRREVIALVLLLTLVVALLVLFHAKRQQVLRKLADDRLYDPLTGLAQRRLFEIRLEAAVARMARTGRPLTLLYCDLDAFKAVNDQHGHNTGDALLAHVAQQLLLAVRDEDMVVRLGGDEFAVLLEATDAAGARDVVARMYDVVQQPVVLHRTPLEPQLSIGGAVLHDSSRSGDLLNAADLAMYEVKAGRDRETAPLTELRSPAGLPEPRRSVDTRTDTRAV